MPLLIMMKIVNCGHERFNYVLLIFCLKCFFTHLSLKIETFSQTAQTVMYNDLMLV